jgi:hypothetical protein
MAEGFVGQQNVGLHRKGPRNRHALAHAAGQLVRIGVGEIAEPQPVEPRQGAVALLGFGQADQFQRQLGVVERRAPGQQAILLKHRRDPAAEMIEVGERALVADVQRAFGRRFEPDHQIEQRGLAAAGLADDGDDLARRDRQIEPVDGHDGLPRGGLPEHLAQAARFDRRRPAHTRHRSRRVSTRATAASSRNNSATSTSVQANTSATENNSCATES